MAKRVLLVYPNIASFPAINLAIPILTKLARQQGWEPYYFDTYRYAKGTFDSNADRELTGEFKPGRKKLDLNILSYEQLLADFQERIDTSDPDLIAVSSMSHDYQLLMQVFPRLKISARAIRLIGGFHAIAAPEGIAAGGVFDLICTGEAESIFVEILRRISSAQPLDQICGTIFCERSSKRVHCNPKRPLLAPFDLWAVQPDYSLFDDSYFASPFDGRVLRKLQVETGRGCPWNCSYCGNTVLKKANAGLGKYVRLRPVSSLLEQLRTAQCALRMDLFQFIDECFLARPRAWLDEFARGYAAEIKKPFILQTRPETITAEALDVLEAFGAPFFQINVGVESGSPRILREVCDRTSRVESVIEAFDLLNQRQIRSCAYFMLGLPGETREDVFRSIELCRRINPTIVSVSIFQPLPGTPLRQRCLELGYITGHEPLAAFTEGTILRMPQLDSQSIHNLRRTFLLYAKLPERYFPEIERCEKAPAENLQLFEDLVNLRWNLEELNRSGGTAA